MNAESEFFYKTSKSLYFLLMQKSFTPYLLFALTALLSLSACKKDLCEGKTDPRVGANYQYFTVEYNDLLGQNKLTNGTFKNGIIAYWNINAIGQGNQVIKEILPAYTDGKFGPFAYTDMYVDPVTLKPNKEVMLNRAISYEFFIRKDTFGIDTFRVTYTLSSDECVARWGNIQYSRNGKVLDAYTNQERAAIRIVE